MDEINIIFYEGLTEDGRYDDNRRHDIHQRPDDEKRAVYGQEKEPFALNVGNDDLREFQRYLFDGKKPDKGHSTGEDEKEAPRKNRRVPADREQTVDLQFPVNKKLDNKGVNDRYRRRLGRGKDTSIDTTEDKNRQQKRPYAIF